VSGEADGRAGPFDSACALPGDVGLCADTLRAAVDYAVAHELSWPRDVRGLVRRFEKPPHNELLGPTKPRGRASGVVIRSGRRVAKWGDPDRGDMTFSAAKSYLSILAGVAFDRGLIRDPEDRVSDYVEDGGFDGAHNGGITWHHLLQQTSEWQGALFGIPDVVDHHRSVGETGGPEKGTRRELRAPGTYWEYNDVRVNCLGLALLRVFGEPLPQVLKREIMDPIGASSTWRWHGYRNSWVDVNGTRMQSVPGGAHWGGGIWISSFDHARVGYLLLRRGKWSGRAILSEEWIARATTPCQINPVYGYGWWLNTGQHLYPAASERAFAAQGAGGNVVVVEPEHDLVLVTRWTSDPAGVLARVIDAVREAA
jgi:CubicO group peptidase (beta-lactamase class C family)